MNLPEQALMNVYPLESDPSGDASVTVRQVAEYENIQRAQMFARTTREVSDELVGTLRLQTEYNQRLLRQKEAYLALASVSGITKNDKELFRSGTTEDGPKVSAAMSESQFNASWGLLPPETAEEISRLVWKTNPTWNPNRESEGE